MAVRHLANADLFMHVYIANSNPHGHFLSLHFLISFITGETVTAFSFTSSNEF